MRIPGLQSGEDVNAVPARVHQLAAKTATLIGVQDYQIEIDDTRDAAPGSGHTVLDTRLITLSSATALDLTDDELMSVLAHEMAHLKRGSRRGRLAGYLFQSTVRSLGIGALAICCLYTALLAGGTWALGDTDTLLQAVLRGLPLATALTGTTLIVLVVAFCRGLQREELACDIELAHAIGTRGSEVLRHDRLHHTHRWVTWATATHPHPTIRAQARHHHAHHHCNCPHN